MDKVKFTPRQRLLDEIACALTDHMTEDYGAGHFVDLTTGEVTFIQGDYMLEDVTPDDSLKVHVRQFNAPPCSAMKSRICTIYIWSL